MSKSTGKRLDTDSIARNIHTMRLVIVESPYAAATPEQIAENVTYARACVRESLGRNEAPIASHILYTQPGILRDEVPAERQWGIDAGLAWRHVSDGTACYIDRGMSRGMRYGIEAAERAGKPVEYRSLAAYDPALAALPEAERAARIADWVAKARAASGPATPVEVAVVESAPVVQPLAA